MASPFGLPPGDATTSTLPSGCTRSTVAPLSSTHSNVPSGIHTGPSGNWRPVAISVTSGWLMTLFPLWGPLGPRLAARPDTDLAVARLVAEHALDRLVKTGNRGRMRIRLDPQDEYMHPLEEASN